MKIRLDASLLGSEALELENNLHKKIVGQDKALHEVTKLYQTYILGMSTPGKPVCSLLFLGPTGIGKTYTVECLAECLVGKPEAVIKIDCAELQHSHEIAKLVGSPPGYLGHRETHPMLSQAKLNMWQTEKVKLNFVLFDEIEKASDSLWNLLLGILDKATLTLGDNTTVDFSKSMIFMTSNLGSMDMQTILNQGMGFQTHQAEDIISKESTKKKMESEGLRAARNKFTPEFINRLDKIISFQPLGNIELREIVELELYRVKERVTASMKEKVFSLHFDKAVVDYLLNTDNDIRYGARQIKRTIETKIIGPITNIMASNQVETFQTLSVYVEDETLAFYKEVEFAA